MLTIESDTDFAIVKFYCTHLHDGPKISLPYRGMDVNLKLINLQELDRLHWSHNNYYVSRAISSNRLALRGHKTIVSLDNPYV